MEAWEDKLNRALSPNTPTLMQKAIAIENDSVLLTDLKVNLLRWELTLTKMEALLRGPIAIAFDSFSEVN